ncbi:hydroxymethylglutaryl-CoA reductase, degradative [Dolosicoccus paucivorans]
MSDHTSFSGFYKKTLQERHDILKELGAVEIFPKPLTDEVANQMVENYITPYTLPLGVGVNFIINNKEYVVPMVTEEPSVIAAASNGAKRLGNIQAKVLTREIIGQIVLTQVNDPQTLAQKLAEDKEKYLMIAQTYCQSMVKRGGGPRDLWVETHIGELDHYVTVYLSMDTKDAMGANAINTVLEGLGDHLQETFHVDPLLCILSNAGDRNLVKAWVEVPFSQLHPNLERAERMALRIAKASEYASIDPLRAVTHNKGVMNGVDAVVVATGNDWRAVEASVHHYISRKGHYQSLTQWTIDQEQKILYGQIELPLPIATVGGTLSVHPTAQWALELLNNPNAKELMEIVASVGLAQNFAALRALVTHGIQKGHMALQARSLAMQVGATVEEVPQVVRALRKQPQMNREVARNILLKLRNNECKH